MNINFQEIIDKIHDAKTLSDIPDFIPYDVFMEIHALRKKKIKSIEKLSKKEQIEKYQHKRDHIQSVFIEMRNNGKTNTDIAESLQIDRSIVNYIFSAKKYYLSQAKVDEIIKKL